jgi:hypothetical protein
MDRWIAETHRGAILHQAAEVEDPMIHLASVLRFEKVGLFLVRSLSYVEGGPADYWGLLNNLNNVVTSQGG